MSKSGYGNVSDRMKKYFKHVDDKRNASLIGQRVTVIKGGAYEGEEGAVVNELTKRSGLSPLYGVVFDWDVRSMPVYFGLEELELCEQ